MEMIYYTIAAIVLYVLSDWILNKIEIKLGKRLENRSFVFFVIILVLSVTTFSIIQSLYQKPVAPTSEQPLKLNKENRE